MKVSELEGVDLDYWVAALLGYNVVWAQDGSEWFDWTGTEVVNIASNTFKPSSCREDGGPIIEDWEVELFCPDRDTWEAAAPHGGAENILKGSTPLEAACRAIVASVYGEGVEDE